LPKLQKNFFERSNFSLRPVALGLSFLGAGDGFIASRLLLLDDFIPVLQKKFTISDSFIRGGEFAFKGAG
jgi:hypothetical protein